MTESTFHPNERQRRRLAQVCKPKEDGTGLEPAYNDFLSYDVNVRRMPDSSAGLFSTAPDMARFYQMMLNGAELQHVLSEIGAKRSLDLRGHITV